MSQLRWTLLILGGVFIAALALWERLRPRQARGRETPSGPGSANEPTLEGACEQNDSIAEPAAGEPWIGQAPPEGAPGAEPLWREGPAPQTDVPPVDALEALAPVLIDTPDDVSALPELSVPVLQPAPSAAPSDTPWNPPDEGVGPVRTVDTVVTHERAHRADEPGADGPTVEPAVQVPSESAPRVQWPPEAERHIVALRVVAGAERFSGRTLRLALAAEGFRLGRFDIFHKPDGQGRAVLSAASLTRPGTFDLAGMDSQRYAGLNLFAVLPGPMPPLQALEALLAAADHLNERLQGEVQDERGEALTEERVALLREALPDGAGGAVS